MPRRIGNIEAVDLESTVAQLAAIIVGCVLAVACNLPPAQNSVSTSNSSSTVVSETLSVTKDSPVEAKLSALEAGMSGQEQTVTRASVREFEAALGALKQVCQQRQVALADMTVAGVQQLRNDGRSMGYLEFLKGVMQLLDSAGAVKDRSVDCRVVFASALTMLEKP